MPTLRPLHRTSALVISAFAVIHLANHLASLWSIDAHTAFLDIARRVYRQPAIEILLLACVELQSLTGLVMAVTHWRRRRGAVARMQAISGLYLALFLPIHTGAVLFGRSVQHLDTNFHFAAAGMHVPPLQYVFGPYYAGAVVALFTHIGCALHGRIRASDGSRYRVIAVPALIGCTLAVVLVTSLAGSIHPFEVPDAYLQTYRTGGTSTPR